MEIIFGEFEGMQQTGGEFPVACWKVRLNKLRAFSLYSEHIFMTPVGNRKGRVLDCFLDIKSNTTQLDVQLLP